MSSEDANSAETKPETAASNEAETPAEAPAEAPAAPAQAKAAKAAKAPADEPPLEPPPDSAHTRTPPWVPLAIAAGLPVLFFFLLPPLSKSGLWDPYELNVADLGRRLALNLFHAGDMALSGADNSLPHLNDLGRPELPFTSIALGFKLFGLHEWAGRAPLALWGVAGVIATYLAVARLVDKRAGVYSAVALTTMPLYFVQARTMMGDIVAMSAVAMAFSGFAVALLYRGDDGVPTPATQRTRFLFLAMGVFGLVVGFYSRGALLCVATPLLGVGVAWAVTWAAGQREKDTLGDVLGVAALVAGVAAVVATWLALEKNDTKNLSLAVGGMIHIPTKYPTFDFVVGHLGPALAPWSAFVPFAMGRLFIPPIGRSGAMHTRISQFRAMVLVAAAVAVVAHGFLEARTDLVAFTAPSILAVACGLAIRDFERGAHGSIAVGVGTGVLLGVLHHDFHELPEKAYQAFAVAGAVFPESFKDNSLLLWTVALIGFAGLAFLTWVEKGSDRAPFDPKNYRAIIDALREAWDGLLALVYFALVAGASLAGLAIFAGTRWHAKWLPTISLQVRDGVLNAWWVTAIVPLAVVLGVYFATDVWLWAFGRARRLSTASLTRGFEPFEELYARIQEEKDSATKLTAILVLVPLMGLAVPAIVLAYLSGHHTRLPVAVALALPSSIALFLALGLLGDLLRGRRAAGFALGGAAVGFVLSFAYYPALANQLSPKEVFESYEKTHKPGEPLGLYGVGGRTAAYYAGGQPPSFGDPQGAFGWLMAGEGGQRRFLAMKAEELPRINQIYRERITPRENLPILDARSSQILLVASRLEDSEKNENPLNKILLSSMPHPQHPFEVNMDDKLLCLGYDVVDPNGKLATVVAPGRKYRMRTYYKVLAPVTTEWEAFIHIDGYHRRHNGDHKPLNGKYPFALWLKDDLIVDDYEFQLEPNFSPGSYNVYFGLFVGETRLKVKSGPSDGDNRVNGGVLRVQ